MASLIASHLRTKNDARANLEGVIADICARHYLTAVFKDTTQVLFPRRLSSIELGMVAKANRSKKLIYFQSKLWGHWGLRLQKPTPQAIALVALIKPKAFINRVDIAFDFCAFNQHDADDMGRNLSQIVTQRWHGKRRGSFYCGTTYSSRRRWGGRNIAIYSDKPSKLLAVPCAHVEVRLTSKPVCDRYGLSEPAQYLKADILDIGMRNLRLTSLAFDPLEERLLADQEMLARKFSYAGHHCKPDQAVLRRLNLFAMGRDADIANIATIPAQNWLEGMKRYAKSSTYHLPASRLINPQQCIVVP